MINVGAVSYRDGENGLEVTCNSWVSGKVTLITIPWEYRERFLMWWDGKLPLDEALPILTPEEEEIILTGILQEEDDYEA
jgi:hypothetical protein